MPQIHRLDPNTDVPQLPNPNLSVFFTRLRRRRFVIALSTTLSLVAAALYLVFATPQFSSSATILIDTKRSAGVRNTQAVADANVEAANIESQVELMRSQRIVRQVILDQKLINDPALAPDVFARTFSAFIKKVAFWKTPQPHDPGDDPALTAAAQALEKRIDAKRIGNTYVIELTAIMPSAMQAAHVVNSYADIYIADQQRLREELSRRQSKMLQDRSTELQLKVRQAEQAVEEMKFAGSYKGTNSAAANVMLKELESSAQNFRSLHDKFLEQATETWQQQYLSIPDAQIASPGYEPLSKSSPKTLLILASTFFFGIAAGVVTILLLDRRQLGLTAN